MKSNEYDKWRREVNIILMDTIGKSLADMSSYVEDTVRIQYENGEDPMDAAQFAANEIDPTIDLDQVIEDRLVAKIKIKSGKQLKKFKVNNE